MSAPTLNRVVLFRDAAAVKRYHTKRVLREQTLGAHSFDMLTLLLVVYPECRKEVMLACIHHDLPELITGDIPAPIKRADVMLAKRLDMLEVGIAHLYKDFNLTEEEAAMLKWADRMELVLWCLEEYRLGNTFVGATIRRGMGWILAAGFHERCRGVTQAVEGEMIGMGLSPATGAELEATR